MTLDRTLTYMVNAPVGHSVIVDATITLCAAYLAYVLIALFVAFLSRQQWSWRTRGEILGVAILSSTCARVCMSGIWMLYQRPRPYLVIPVHHLQSIVETTWSFPSGHATFSFGLATVVYLYHKRWGYALFVLAALVSLARVAAGVHYPSDILAGAVLGSAISWLIYKLFARYPTLSSH